MTVTKMTRSAAGLGSTSDDWRDDAACSGMDTEAFAVHGLVLSPENHVALRVCGNCPVVQQCHDDWGSMEAPRRTGWIAGGVVWSSKKGLPRTDPRGTRWTP